MRNKVQASASSSSREAQNMVGFMVASEQRGKCDFEKFFITSADDAARGVKHDIRRVLIAPFAHVQIEVPKAFRALVLRSNAARRFVAGTVATPVGLATS